MNDIFRFILKFIYLIHDIIISDIELIIKFETLKEFYFGILFSQNITIHSKYYFHSCPCYITIYGNNNLTWDRHCDIDPNTDT